MVPFAEIEKNEFNLNLPRYIDSQTPEDLQDIAGHLQGGIPVADVDALQRYWDVCPQLRHTLFKEHRPGYLDLAVEKAAIKPPSTSTPEFDAFIAGMNEHFGTWRKKSAVKLKALKAGCHPKEVIGELSESARPLRRQAAHRPLRRLSAPDGLLGETMQDDCYLDRRRRLEGRDHAHHREGQEGQGEGQGLDLRPHPQSPHRRPLLRRRTTAIDRLAARLDSVTAGSPNWRKNTEVRKDAFADFDKVNKRASCRAPERDPSDKARVMKPAVLSDWLKLHADEAIETSQGSGGRARRQGLREVSDAHRGRDQDARRGRQMARRPRRRHPRRDGPREPAAHPAREGTGRALRNPLPQMVSRQTGWKPR